MKVIRIDDTLHEHLKREAKRNGRTLNWWIESKLMLPTSEPGTLPTKSTEPTVVSDNQEWSPIQLAGKSMEDLYKSGLLQKGVK